MSSRDVRIVCPRPECTLRCRSSKYCRCLALRYFRSVGSAFRQNCAKKCCTFFAFGENRILRTHTARHSTKYCSFVDFNIWVYSGHTAV